MYKCLILLFLFVASFSEAYELVPPYQLKYGNSPDLTSIYKNRPIENKEVPFFLKPPSTLAAGDQPSILATKYMMSQADYLLKSIKDNAEKVAKESNPALAKSIEKVANPNVTVETFHIHHNLKYDLPSEVALYTAEASSVYFTARHEGFTSSDMISLAYRLNAEESVGVRYTDANSSYILFLEGSW